MGNIEHINVWKQSIQLAKKVYILTKTKKELSLDYGLKDQMQRAAVSIASNIAEGNDRNTYKEYIHFLHIAKGSSIELLTQIIISYEIGYISLEDHNELKQEITSIHKQLNGFIKHLHTSKNAVGSL